MICANDQCQQQSWSLLPPSKCHKDLTDTELRKYKTSIDIYLINLKTKKTGSESVSEIKTDKREKQSGKKEKKIIYYLI